MKPDSEPNDSEPITQEHCIDLPGETVQCWIRGNTDKLKVILRKHRDVVFDIHLGNEQTYTLEATESDFYNPRDKKLVYAARHGKVVFKDGERMHIWISRGFRGALILKCGDNIISKIRPNDWDKQHYSNDPKEKPAPIIVAIAPRPVSVKPTAITRPPSGTAVHQEEQTLHVHEATKDHAPPAILKFFEDGGESLELDSTNIITRNWITSQLAGATGYILDNRTWINELKGCKFRLQKVVHKSGSKIYIIFSGNNTLREIMSGSRYSLQHSKIMKITGGAGGLRQTWETSKSAAKDTFKVVTKEEGKIAVKGAGMALVFTIGMDVTEWYKDYSETGPDGKPKKDFCDLFAKIGTDLVKAGLIAALTDAAVSGFFALLALGGVAIGAPVLAIVVGTIFVGVALTFLVELGDKTVGHALGEADTTTWFAKKFRETAQHLMDVSKDVRYERYMLTPILPIMR